MTDLNHGVPFRALPPSYGETGDVYLDAPSDLPPHQQRTIESNRAEVKRNEVMIRYEIDRLHRTRPYGFPALDAAQLDIDWLVAQLATAQLETRQIFARLYAAQMGGEKL